ncbi:MAG: hypothetical protein OXH92_01190 [Bryobacterales bacterium]|nr:hypothetical protein [Bryobacterales bacterium]
MRGLEIETRSEARFKVAGLVRGKRLDDEAKDGARSKDAGPVRSHSVEIGSRAELSEAIRRESSKLEKSGAVIRKVWGKTEIESYVDGKAQEARRESHDPYAGDNAERRAARELGLHYREGRVRVEVVYPEAQIEYADKAGGIERLNISVAQESRIERGQRWREEARQRHLDRSIERGERARSRDPERERIPFDERKRRAAADVAAYRVVSVKDLIEERFGGNAFAGRKGIDQLKRAGLLKEHTVTVRSGKYFKVLTATEKGCREARDHSPDTEQRYFSGLVKPKELRHDVAVYRAARAEIAQLEQRGATVKRVRLDYELKSRVARATERERARKGREAAQKAKVEAARELGLPIDEQGRVHYPDAQIEYEDAMGVSERVSVEVTSGNYRGKHIQPKAAAGFVLYANGRAAARKLGRSLALDPEGSKRGGGGGRRKDDVLFDL